MSKKLVKTAKQLFEERLRELGLLTSYQGVKDERLYLCENDNKEMSILRDSKEWGFIEYKYQGSYQSMVDSEEFLYNMVCRFNEIGEPVKYIFDWYASAEKDLTPFTVYDIWQCMEYLSQEVFEDLYEEVEEPKVLTAREKWDAASVVAQTLWSNDAETVKVEQTESFVRFYRADDILSCYEYPSLEEMRKDETFSIRIMEVLLESCQTEHLGKFFNWVKCGGSFPLPIEIIFHSEYQNYKFTEYEDDCKESSKHDFKKQIDALRKKMVEHIIQLCEQGMTLNVGSFLQNVYSITWVSGSYYACANIKDVYFRKNDEGRWEFSYESKSDAQGDSSDCFLDELTIETLQDIIASMQ